MKESKWRKEAKATDERVKVEEGSQSDGWKSQSDG